MTKHLPKYFLNPTEKQGVQAFIAKVRDVLGDNIVDLIIFGSKVTGNFDAESDIDILVVLSRRTWAIQDEICRVATDINLQLGINLSPVIITKAEYEKNESHNTGFAQEINLTGVQV
jgi:predicted nucleotidyltransferase